MDPAELMETEASEVVHKHTKYLKVGALVKREGERDREKERRRERDRESDRQRGGSLPHFSLSHTRLCVLGGEVGEREEGEGGGRRRRRESVCVISHFTAPLADPRQ